MIDLNKRNLMTLEQYFATKPRGAKIAMARKLGISKTWFSLVISGRQPPSAVLAMSIERCTEGQVRRTLLRPDLFGELN
jgi:DNA-binding transcriptional regulator YdaS (Cro superfamily)